MRAAASINMLEVLRNTLLNKHSNDGTESRRDPLGELISKLDAELRNFYRVTRINRE